MEQYRSNLVTCLFFFFWFSCLTSQSLMDLSDFLIFSVGISILVYAAKSKKNWALLWPDSTGLKYFWLTWLIVIAIGLFVNNPISKDTVGALLEFRWMLTFQVLCFTLCWIRWDIKKINLLMTILLVLVLASFVIYTNASDPRAGGLFEHSMPFAHTYGTAFVFVAGFSLVAFRNKEKWRWFAFLTTALCAIISVMSQTRGIWIGMFLGTICISLMCRWRYGVLLTSFLSVIFAITLGFSPEARQRTFSTNSSTNESDNQRKALWKGNIEIVKDYPIFGSGYGQNRNLLRHYYDKFNYPKDQFISHAHNQYLHFWAGTGTVGLICFLAFLSQCLRLTWLAYSRISAENTILRGLALGSLGAQVCFSVAALTESNFSIAKNRYIFLLISAIGISIYYRYVAKKNFELYLE